jgi:hypothetical protein
MSVSRVKGVWAEINGKDVFIASKVKKDPDFEIIKVRLTKDGTPFWTMTPEQLAMETKRRIGILQNIFVTTAPRV